MKNIYFINSQHIVPPFLMNEILEASKYFDNVILVSPLFFKQNVELKLPSNVIYEFSSKIKIFFHFILAIFHFKPPFFRKDRKKAKKSGKYSFDYWFKSMRTYSNALLLFSRLNRYFKKYGQGNIVSSWFDSSALAISIFKSKHSLNFSCSSFCHSFEVDESRNGYVNLLFYEFIISKLDRIYFISKNILKRYFAFCDKTQFTIDKTKFSIRYLGIMNVFLPLETYRGTNEVLNILSVSTMNAVKRIPLIIDSLKLVKRKVNWFHFGDGPLENEIINKAKHDLPKNISFNFLGRKDNKEVLQFYIKESTNIALFINLSSSEGIPVSIMECMSFGIPCIATDVGGTNELVNDDNGFLVSKDIACAKISDIIENLNTDQAFYLRKREFAYKMIKKSFDGKENAKLFYKQL